MTTGVNGSELRYDSPGTAGLGTSCACRNYTNFKESSIYVGTSSPVGPVNWGSCMDPDQGYPSLDAVPANTKVAASWKGISVRARGLYVVRYVSFYTMTLPLAYSSTAKFEDQTGTEIQSWHEAKELPM